MSLRAIPVGLALSDSMAAVTRELMEAVATQAGAAHAVVAAHAAVAVAVAEIDYHAP